MEEAEGQEVKNKGGRPRKRRLTPRKKAVSRRNPRSLVYAAIRAKAKERARQPEVRKKLRENGLKGSAKAKALSMHRNGVPDGWTRETADMQRVYDGIKADLMMDRMKAEGMVEETSAADFERMTVQVNGKNVDVLVPVTDKGRADAALHAAMIGALSPLTNAKERVSYIRTVLEYTKAKPAQSTNVNLAKSEDWLDAALKDNAKPYDETDPGADRAP